MDPGPSAGLKYLEFWSRIGFQEVIVIMRRVAFVIFLISMIQQGFSIPGVKIRLLHYSQKDWNNSPGIIIKSQGIPTVLVGQTVYLTAEVEGEGQKAGHYQWSLETPDHSSATLDNPVIPNPTLVLFTEGQYRVILTVTSASGVSSRASLWLTAATFVGSGAVVNTGNKAQCIHCHQDKVISWQNTPHAGTFQRGLEGKLSHGYLRIYCFYCHKGGPALDKVWQAMGKKEHWHYLEAPGAAIFAELLRDLPEVANLTSVQCESCHGPGSQHLGQTGKNQICASPGPGICALCHEKVFREAELVQWSHPRLEKK